MPVDDPRAVQIVGRKLAADAIAGEDADAESPHLAGHMPEHHVVVVELHTEHRVGQGLDDLALEFNLVLLRHAVSHLGRLHGVAAVRCFGYSDSNYQCVAREGCSKLLDGISAGFGAAGSFDRRPAAGRGPGRRLAFAGRGGQAFAATTTTVALIAAAFRF